MTETAQALVPLLAYQERRAQLCPTVESIRWFVRQHRDELVSRGALLLIAARWQIDVERFDAYVLEAGKAQAQRRAVAA